PFARRATQPAVAETGSTNFTRAAPVAPKILDEAVKTTHWFAAGMRAKGDQMLPCLRVVVEEPAFVTCLLSLDRRPDREPAGFVCFPLIRPQAFAARAFTAEAGRLRTDSFVQHFHALLQRHLVRVIAPGRVPDRENHDLVRGRSQFLHPEIAGVPAAGHKVTAWCGLLDRYLVVEKISS